MVCNITMEDLKNEPAYVYRHGVEQHRDRHAFMVDARDAVKLTIQLVLPLASNGALVFDDCILKIVKYVRLYGVRSAVNGRFSLRDAMPTATLF